MSALLEWAKALEAPGGVLAGIFGTKVFGLAKERRDLRLAASQEMKIDADAAEVLTKIAVSLVAPLEARISKLERENSAAFDYIRTLLAWIRGRLPGETPPQPPAVLALEL